MHNSTISIVFYKFLTNACLVWLLWFYYCNSGYANNTAYIALANHIARRTELEIAANNMANINTDGFEADGVIFKNIDLPQSSTRANSFVCLADTYKSDNKGPIKMTYRPMDVAILGDGYFKVLTPRGDRYTLNGAIFINNEYTLVNISGLPLANNNNQPIVIPIDYQDINISADGTVYADGEEIDVIGVFAFPEPKAILKEGNNLYSSKARDILLAEFTIISGALRGSNVSSAAAMMQMVELQRSAAMTNNLMSNIADLERSVITKIAK